MIIPPASSVSSEERLLSALAHASVLLFSMGFIVPLIIWITQRKKSAFVAFHALQALVYQLFQMVYWYVFSFFLFLLMMAVFMGFITVFERADSSSPVIFLLPQITIFGGMFLGFALYAFFGLLGAVLTLSRKEYRYPILGRWLEKYLTQPPAVGNPATPLPPADHPEPDTALQTKEAA
jgi:uncharacterized Tic20 family protein